MAGMKRAAKLLMKGGDDLEVCILDLKSLQEVISGKLIPMINNVSTTLLKWSYTEANYTFPNVFSAWADLDAAFTQLLQEYLQECSRYRKCFKAIIIEAKRVSEVQKEKERTGHKVAAAVSKLESAKKTAKKNESSEKTKMLVVNLEAEVSRAIRKDAATEELLKNTLADFEFYKVNLLKDSLVAHCHALKILLQKGMELCKVKLEVAESMPAAPAMTPEGLTDNDARVEEVFSQFSLQLPPRDPALERNLPVQRFKTIAPPQSLFKSSVVAQKAFEPSHVPVTVKPFPPTSGLDRYSDNEDGDDYTIPDEKAISKSPVEKPPQLPPRSAFVSDEEDYVVPTLGQKLENKTNNHPLSSPVADDGYFQFASEDDDIYSNSEISQVNLPPSEQGQDMEPVYFVPPDDDSNDYNQHYGNVITEELQNNQEYTVVPERQPPYTKPRRPAVFPKPSPKTPREIPSRSKKDSSHWSARKAPSDEDDDMYLAEHQDEIDNPTADSPVAMSARSGFDPPTGSSNIKARPGHCFRSSPEPIPPRSTPTSTPDSEDHEIRHTYFSTAFTETENARNQRNYDSDVSQAPPVARKPAMSGKKPPIPARGNFKH